MNDILHFMRILLAALWLTREEYRLNRLMNDSVLVSVTLAMISGYEFTKSKLVFPPQHKF